MERYLAYYSSHSSSLPNCEAAGLLVSIISISASSLWVYSYSSLTTLLSSSSSMTGLCHTLSCSCNCIGGPFANYWANDWALGLGIGLCGVDSCMLYSLSLRTSVYLSFGRNWKYLSNILSNCSNCLWDSSFWSLSFRSYSSFNFLIVTTSFCFISLIYAFNSSSLFYASSFYSFNCYWRSSICLSFSAMSWSQRPWMSSAWFLIGEESLDLKPERF